MPAINWLPLQPDEGFSFVVTIYDRFKQRTAKARLELKIATKSTRTFQSRAAGEPTTKQQGLDHRFSPAAKLPDEKWSIGDSNS